MRRIWLVVLLLLAVGAQAQDFMRYYPAGGVSGEKLFSYAVALNVTTTGTSEEILKTVTIPAGSFPATAIGFRVFSTWQTAANANGKIGRIWVNGPTGSNLIQINSTANDKTFSMELTCLVTAAAEFVCQGSTGIEGSTTAVYTVVVPQTVANEVTLVAAGTTATASGDISLTSMVVFLITP